MLAKSVDFREHFKAIEEPRMARTRQHALIDILFISVAGTIAGCDGPTDIEDFAKSQLQWCRKFIKLENGVPSHDTISRVLALMKPDQFQEAFLNWIAAQAEVVNGDSQQPRFVPIDGKTLRGSGGAKHRENPLHLVSAWSTELGITLGQVAVEAKSNEITAIPKLLEMLELNGAIVSIDAMGCQREIAAQIVNHDGDYVLAVKENQPKLSAAVEEFFLERHEEQDFSEYGGRRYTTTERAQGADVTRDYAIAPLPDSMRSFAGSWKGLTSIGQAITTTLYSNGRETSEVRYYISSRPAKVREFARSVRGHWSIESMHWILDVVFNEDASRLRNGASTENFSFLRKFVIGLLKRDTSKGSLKGKRKKAAWSTEFLENILFG